VEVPFTVKDGSIRVPVTINGRRRTFLLDTGDAAGFTLGSVKEAGALGLKSVGLAVVGGVSGKALAFEVDAHLKLGDRDLGVVRGDVLDGCPSDLLGFGALSKLGKLTIDFERKVLSFDNES